MEFKKLKWQNNIVKEYRKPGGEINLVAFVNVLDLDYSICQKQHLKLIGITPLKQGNYYACYMGRRVPTETLKDAKDICQAHFEKTIKKLFFK